MEEILASIRRIISEEDRPAESGGDVLDLQPPPAPVAETRAPSRPEPEPEPVFKATPNFDFDEPEDSARGAEEDLMILEHEEEVEFEALPEPEPQPVVAPKAAPKGEWRPIEQETLTSEPVAAQTAGALSKLMGSMLVSSGATLDDVVRELLKPMLKQWLDANLPQIVEAEVAKEIDRIRRMAR
jgi:hypothetical protein